MVVVAENIRYIRHSQRLSQQEMADQLGIKRSLLGAYEEARATPRYPVLEKLSVLSGISVSDLLNKNMVPEDFTFPARGGRKPSGAQGGHRTNAPTAAKGAARQEAPLTTGRTEPMGTRLLVTVEAGGIPIAGLVPFSQLADYGARCHLPSYVASLASLSLPQLDANQAYRAFEVALGQIHIGQAVRNWSAILPTQEAYYLLVYPKSVVLAQPMLAGKGLEWKVVGSAPAVSGKELLEIWQTVWVLSNQWSPLTDVLANFEKRLAAVETLLQ
jgi:transcriptional regulator with XRE-family HTH domain